jgi:CoA:oxalate CoA-transferase
MAITGRPDDAPMRGGGALADYVGGLYLALGVVAALLDRDRGGPARVLDLSNQDAVFAITDSAATIHHALGLPSRRLGNQHPHTAPYDAFEARDGFVVVATASNRLFRRLCEAIGRPELGRDRRFRHHDERARNREEINGIVAEWVATRSCDEVLALLGPSGADVPCARVSSPEELVDDPQLVLRDMIERHPHPELGEILFHGNPLKLSGSEPRRLPLAPDLGQHNREVYAELGVTGAQLEQLRQRGVI